MSDIVKRYITLVLVCVIPTTIFLLMYSWLFMICKWYAIILIDGVIALGTYILMEIYNEV